MSSTLVMEEKLKSIHNLISEFQQNPTKVVLSMQQTMDIHTIIYNMCSQKPSDEYYCPRLYSMYCESVKHCTITTGLHLLREKLQENNNALELLRMPVDIWTTHKRVVRKLAFLFRSLDRGWIRYNKQLSLEEVGYSCFRDLVYHDFKEKVTDFVIDLIHQGREGKDIDWDLVNNSIDMFACMGEECYENDFEVVMLKETIDYYSHKASEWMEDFSLGGYVAKLDECLIKERSIVSPSVHKLVWKTEEILLNELLNKVESNDSIRYKLFTDEEVVNPSKIMILFTRIPRGLEKFANLFRRHIQAQCKALAIQVKHKRIPFVGHLRELHERYHLRVRDCYMNHYLFKKAWEVAFIEIYKDQDVLLALRH